MIRCLECGAESPLSARFCTGCGERLYQVPLTRDQALGSQLAPGQERLQLLLCPVGDVEGMAADAEAARLAGEASTRDTNRLGDG